MLWSEALLTKFGNHRAFLRQIDLWMTFDPRSGRFENMPTNLVGPSPTPMQSFSLIPRSMTKRIAGHTYIYTHTHTHRLHYFSSIDCFLTISGENSARTRFHIFFLKFLNSFLCMHMRMNKRQQLLKMLC